MQSFVYIENATNLNVYDGITGRPVSNVKTRGMNRIQEQQVSDHSQDLPSIDRTPGYHDNSTSHGLECLHIDFGLYFLFL